MIPRFCIQNRITDREATPCSVEHLKEVMFSPEVQDICDRIKLLDQEYPNGGDEKKEELSRLKRQLPVITPHAQKFINNERKNQNAIPSGLCMLDIDDVEDPAQLSHHLDGDQLKNNDIYFIAITPSGHGLRVIAERQPSESIQAAQQRLSSLFGVSRYDSSTKDPARASFVMPVSYLLYVDEEKLSFPSQDEADRIAQSFSTSSSPSSSFVNYQAIESPSVPSSTMRQPSSDDAQSSPSQETLGNPSSSQETLGNPSTDLGQPSLTYKDIPYATIVTHLVNLLGGTPQQGERNTFYFTLVKYIRYICDFNATQVFAILPDFGLSEQERHQIITSAINRPRKSYIPDMLQRALSSAQIEADSETKLGEQAAETLQPATCNLPPKLPKVLEVICHRLPEAFRPAMVIASLPVLGTLATKVRFHYLDHQEHSFSFMSCITAPAATGKSFIRRPVNLLLTPIDEQDEVEREKEQEYKDKLRAAKNNKVQPENPRACPRNNGINISIAKLLQLLSYSDGKHLIGIGEEIDTLVKSERAGVWSQKSDIYRLGFDNAKYGQNYMSDNSFSANVPVYYNLLLTGTPGGMYRFFKDVEDGLVTRFAFAQLPDMFGTDIPDFQPYTATEETEIIRIARMLDMASGTITCPAVDDAISHWLQEKKEAAIAADSRAIDTLRKRAAVMGFRAGYLAALLNGSAHRSTSKSSTAKRSRKSTDSPIHQFTDSPKLADAANFALWVAEYIFQNQMQLFGDKFEAVAEQQESSFYRQKGSVQSLLAQLPTDFERKDLISIRARCHQSSEVKVVLSRWIKAGYIIRNDDGSYHKIAANIA